MRLEGRDAGRRWRRRVGLIRWRREGVADVVVVGGEGQEDRESVVSGEGADV